MSGSQGRPGWLYAIIPFAAIGSTVGSFVKLYILDLGGSVLDVGLASSAFNLALIPAAFISGRLADYLGRRTHPPHSERRRPARLHRPDERD